MEHLTIILICLVFGYLFKAFRLVPPNSFLILNKIVTHLCLPALVITKIGILNISVQSNFFATFLWPILMPWLFFFVAIALALIFQKFFKFSHPVLGVIILLGGLGNTAFVGFPLVEAFYGKEGLKTGVLVDQLGSFFVLAILGTLFASYFSGKQVKIAAVVRRILFFPPFFTLMFLMLLRLYFSVPSFVINTLNPISDMLAPIALLSIGMQLNLNFKHHQHQAAAVAACLAIKLVIGPLIIFIISLLLFDKLLLPAKIVVFESAMAPMISAGIIATDFGLPEAETSQIITVGTILSFVTIPIWYAVLQYF